MADKRTETMLQLFACSDLSGSDVKNKSVEWANACKVALYEAGSNGWLGNYATGMLAMRQQPLRSPSSSSIDNGATLMNNLVNTARRPAPNNQYQCTIDDDCDKRPVTKDERDGALFSDVAKPKTLNPRRGLPVNIAGATINGYADGMMTPERYTLNADRASIPQTASAIRSSRPDAQRDNEMQACLVEQTGTSRSACSLVGAREAIVQQAANPNIVYAGSQFIGGAQFVNKPATGASFPAPRNQQLTPLPR